MNVELAKRSHTFLHIFLHKSLVFFNIVDDDDVMLKNLKLFWLTTASNKSEETLKSFFVLLSESDSECSIILNSKVHQIWPKSAQNGAQIFFSQKSHIFGEKVHNF